MPWRWLRRSHALAQLESAGDSHGEQQQQSEELEYVLYHQTSPDNAMAILKCGCMRPGPKGYGGSGIYFAPDPMATTCKANHHGVILECVVQLGRVRHVGKAGDWGSRLRQRLLRYDSVALTFLEGGVEYVVFDPSRVRDIRVHKVLHTSCSSSGISAESSSSSFKIATAPDPTNHCRCSSSSSSSHASDAGSSGRSVCDEGFAEQSSSLWQQEVRCGLGSCDDNRTDHCDTLTLTPSASKPQHADADLVGLQQQPAHVWALSVGALQQQQQQQPGHNVGLQLEQQQRWCQQQLEQQQALGLQGEHQPATNADIVVLLPVSDPASGSQSQRCSIAGDKGSGDHWQLALA